MTLRVLPVAFAAALAFAGSLAHAEEDVTLTPETEGQIKTMLTEQGYEVRKVQTEDGMFEAYALKDGKKYEIYLDDKLQIVNLKED
ncbi:MAG: PepSY domain-containing protein [Rhodobacteraceae bacterium]|nr:PepSY domain-containing protein [Paracoccaceae bacterium]